MASGSPKESQETIASSSLGDERETDVKVKDWRRKLIDRYQKGMSCMRIQPIPDNKEKPAHFIDIYVQPRMEIIPAQSSLDSRIGSSHKKQFIYSYSDLFAKGSCKRAFISSCTGMGKTTFVKKMVLTWCQAWQGREETDCKLKEEDVKFMKRFDLLLYIKQGQTSESDVTDKILEWLYQDQQEASDTRTEMKYNCLLILDDVNRSGLDQYNAFENFTILRTSRSDIPAEREEMHVTLCLLTHTASQQLQKNVIRHFNGTSSSDSCIQKDMDKFDDEISESNLGQLRYVPSFLLQELWLWKYREPSKNKFEAHRYRIEQMLLSAQNEGLFCITGPNKKIPDYIKNAENFDAFYHHFLKLGETAFEMLCEQLTDLKDVVSTKEMRKYPPTSEARFFEFFERIGILTLSSKQIVFTETTVQEFFAAIYVAGEWNDTQKKRSIAQNFLGLPNVLKMSSVLNFVKDMDIMLYEDICDTVINRVDLDMYLEGYKTEGMNVSVYGGRFLHFEEGEMGKIVRDCKEKNLIANGRFGPVYKCSKLEAKYGILAVNKIELVTEMKNEVMNCINQEWLASRYLNPFLLSTMTILRTVSVQKQTFYLISPFCKHGSLYDALHVKEHKVTLNWVMKVRIIVQMALGIEYLHSCSRKPMVHMKVCSKNIVLDGQENARLINYSYSRQAGTTDNLTATSKLEDYKNFGVVIAELLTNKKPEDIERENLQELQCPADLHELKTDFEDIAEIAVKCFEANSSFSLQSDVIEKLRGIWDSTGLPVLDWSKEKCIICMVNVGKLDSESRHRCYRGERVRICSMCEKSLYTDSLKCFQCGAELQHDTRKDMLALLIAGNDQSTNYASVLVKDVENMKKVLTSPEIFDISEENVRLVKPDYPGKEDNMIEKFERAVNELEVISNHSNVNDHHDENEQTLQQKKTLLLYFTGHGKDGIQLGIKKDKLLLDDLQKSLNRLNVQNAVIFLDCGNAPEVRLKENIRTVQINACRPTETGLLTINEGSLFTGYFIRALIEAATKNPRPDDSSITAFSLFQHCTRAMEKDGVVKPLAFYSQGCIQYEDIKIARRISEPFKVTLYCENQEETIPLPRSMVEFERDIFLIFAKGQDEYSVKITVKPDNRICQIRDVIKAIILQEKLIVKFERKTFEVSETVRILI